MTGWDWLDYEYSEIADEFGDDLNISDEPVAEEVTQPAENLEVSNNTEEPEMAE